VSLRSGGVFFFVEVEAFGDTWWRVKHEHWYHFATLRAVDHAARRSAYGLGKELVAATSGLDVLVALRAALSGLDPAVRVEVANRFRVDDPVGARGVPREVLQRSPGLLDVMSRRYSALLGVVQDPGAPCPTELALIMKHPGAGCLLSDLSQIRSLLGEGQLALADYSRVLPWNAMGILASDLFFRLFYWLALMTARVYKPMHSWELQHRLWCLSSFGTDEERFAYFLDQFERIYSGVDQARGTGRKAHAVERAYNRFEANLVTLAVRDEYLQFDRPYSFLVAQRAQPTRRRAIHSVRGTVSDAAFTDDRSVLSTTAPRGSRGPIGDLAEFGASCGWDARTPLHTVLSATEGRVNSERAYLYWCSLSPVTKPQEIPRTRWVPRLKLNSREALAFRSPGLSSPETFVAVRDQQLRDLLEQRQ